MHDITFENFSNKKSENFENDIDNFDGDVDMVFDSDYLNKDDKLYSKAFGISPKNKFFIQVKL